MNRRIAILTGVIFCLLFIVGFAVAQTGEEPDVQKQDQNYWQEVIGNNNKILIALPSKTVETLGTKGIKDKWGNYYKSKEKYYVAVNKNNHKKMLGEQWGKSIKAVEKDKRWQALMKESNYEKEKVGKYLKGQRGDVSPGGGTTGGSSGGSSQ